MASPRSSSGTGADATTGARVKVPLTLRIYNMNGTEYELKAAATATVGELSRHVAEQVGVEPPNGVHFLLDLERLDPLQPLGQRFAPGEVHELTFVISEDPTYAAAARKLLESVLAGNLEGFDLLLAGGAPVTATMSEQDAQWLGTFGNRLRRLKLGAGATALHLAALRHWDDGCRRALRAPGGAEAAALEVEVRDFRDDGTSTDWRWTPRQLYAWTWGEQGAEAVFGAA